jgi:hypothetical protein
VAKSNVNYIDNVVVCHIDYAAQFIQPSLLSKLHMTKNNFVEIDVSLFHRICSESGVEVYWSPYSSNNKQFKKVIKHLRHFNWFIKEQVLEQIDQYEFAKRHKREVYQFIKQKGIIAFSDLPLTSYKHAFSVWTARPATHFSVDAAINLINGKHVNINTFKVKDGEFEDIGSSTIAYDVLFEYYQLNKGKSQ